MAVEGIPVRILAAAEECKDWVADATADKEELVTEKEALADGVWCNERLGCRTKSTYCLQSVTGRQQTCDHNELHSVRL